MLQTADFFQCELNLQRVRTSEVESITAVLLQYSTTPIAAINRILRLWFFKLFFTY